MKARFISSIGLFVICAAVWACTRRAGTAEEIPRAQLFDQIWTTVRDDFYDARLHGVNWVAMKDRYRTPAAAAETQSEFARIINEMLDTLEASHTVYLTWENPRYYQLLGVFESSDAYEKQLNKIRQSLPLKRLAYVGIGVDTLTTDEGVFVAGIYDGSPAGAAGLLVGDRIVDVDGQAFHPIRSFRDCEGRQVSVTYQRVRSGPIRELHVTPREYLAAEMFHEAARNSARIIATNERRIAYVHLWSYSGARYQELLESLLFAGPLKDADALLLDLRDGWGGASPSYLNLFNRDIPLLTMTQRNAEPVLLDSQWRKPVALLINGGVRSGKEAFAYGFKKSNLGPVVGSPTPGAVLAGALRFLPDNSVLYLAVGDIHVDDCRLEGVGVEPTVRVDRAIPYCAGSDPQLDAGLGNSNAFWLTLCYGDLLCRLVPRKIR